MSDAIRATVQKVGDLTMARGEATVVQVAAGLGIDKSSASRRVRTALERGYLRNLEDHRGRPARLVLGDHLPADVTILPTVEDLERLHGCSGGGGDDLPIEADYPRSAWDPNAGLDDDDLDAERWPTAAPPAPSIGEPT